MGVCYVLPVLVGRHLKAYLMRLEHARDGREAHNVREEYGDALVELWLDRAALLQSCCNL